MNETNREKRRMIYYIFISHYIKKMKTHMQIRSVYANEQNSYTDSM